MTPGKVCDNIFMKFAEEVQLRAAQHAEQLPWVEDAPGAELQRNPVEEFGDAALRHELPDGREMWIPAYASPESDEQDVLVFGMPGMLRDSKNYFGIHWDCVRKAGRAHTTRLVVPNIVTEVDIITEAFAKLVHGDARFLHEGELNVPYSGLTTWKDGELWLNEGLEPAVSTYSLLDAAFLLALEKGYNKVCIALNSASAQAGGRGWLTCHSEALAQLHDRGGRVHAVAAGGSSYLWLTPDRPEQYDPADELAVQSWRYGTRNMPAVLDTTPERIIAQVQAGERPTVFLVGERDTGSTIGAEGGAAAMAQGRDRRERHRNYYGHMRDLKAQDVQFGVVPGATHAAAEIYGSAMGRMALFEPEKLPAFDPVA